MSLRVVGVMKMRAGGILPGGRLTSIGSVGSGGFYDVRASQPVAGDAGGAIALLDIPVPRFHPMGPRTDEDTISLLRRLARCVVSFRRKIHFRPSELRKYRSLTARERAWGALQSI
jgi:hypothetical protein